MPTYTAANFQTVTIGAPNQFLSGMLHVYFPAQFSPALGVTPDTTPPEISNLSPSTPGAVGKNGAIQFDVTDAMGLATVVVIAKFPNLERWEGVFDGSTFGPEYLGSSVEETEGGFHFEIARVKGWPDLGVTLEVLPVDTSGMVPE